MRRLAGCVLALFLFCCHSSDPVLWHIRLQSRSYANPVVDGELVYIVSSAGEVLCISNRDGKVLWRKRIDSAIVAAPAVSGTSVFAGTQNGSIVAFDKRNGTLLWGKKFPGEGFEAPLTMMGTALLAPSIQGKLYALSGSDGHTIWTHSGTGQYSAAARVTDSHIFIGGWGGDFFCIRQDGKEEWRFKAGARIVDPATVFRNVICVPTHGQYLLALDSPSGKLLWRFAATYPTSVVPVADHGFFASNSDLYEIRLQDAQLVRKLPIGKTILNISPAPNGVLVVTDHLLRVDASDRLRSIPGLPPSQHPYRFADSRFCYIVIDDLYSVDCIRKQS